MDYVPEHIDELIAKVLTGEASHEEQMDLQQWLNESDENRQYFEQMQAILSRAAQIHEVQQFDTDAAWEKVQSQLFGAPTVVKMYSQHRIWWRIAAVFVLGIGIGLFIWNSPNGRTSYEAYAVNAVVNETLPDGTRTTLNKQSKVVYSEDSKKKIRKAVLQGEAFFEIESTHESQFIVMANEVQILDIGTAFNVKNIDGQDTLEVFVKEGEVHMFTEKDNGLRLRANELGYYIKSSKRFEKPEVFEVDNPAAYVNRQFNFRNSPLKKVIRQINEVYDIELRLSNAELGNCRITVSFDNDDIDTIASIIAETMGWEVHTVGQSRVLTGLSCDE